MRGIARVDACKAIAERWRLGAIIELMERAQLGEGFPGNSSSGESGDIESDKVKWLSKGGVSDNIL